MAIKLFEFFARRTNVEWGHIKPKEKAKGKNYLTTSHNYKSEAGISDFAQIIINLQDIGELIHSHPRNTEKPSGRKGTSSEGRGDIALAKFINTKVEANNSIIHKLFNWGGSYTSEIPTYLIYTPKTGKYHPYDENTR